MAVKLNAAGEAWVAPGQRWFDETATLNRQNATSRGSVYVDTAAARAVLEGRKTFKDFFSDLFRA